MLPPAPEIKPAEPKQNTTEIFIRFIPRNVSTEQAAAELGKAGAITALRLKEIFHVNREDGSRFVSHQNAYVLYPDIRHAQKCIQIFDETEPFEHQKKALKVDFFQPREERKKQEDEQHMDKIAHLIFQVSNQFGGVGAPET